MSAGRFGGRADVRSSHHHARDEGWSAMAATGVPLGSIAGAVAIIDRNGTIVAHNSEWAAWLRHPSRGERWVGVSYSDACAQMGAAARLLAGAMVSLLGQPGPADLVVDVSDGPPPHAGICRVRARSVRVRSSRHLLLSHEVPAPALHGLDGPSIAAKRPSACSAALGCC